MSQEALQGQKQITETQSEDFTHEEFMRMLDENFRPSNDERRQGIATAVEVMIEQALLGAHVISDDVYATVDAMRVEIDKRLSHQMNEIIHNDEFMKLESAWRGLHYLVMNTPTGADLKIQVMNVSKPELLRMFRRYPDAKWDQSPLFKRIYEEDYGVFGGQPFGAFTCDYEFDHSGQDLEVMRGLTRIGGAAHCPFIAAAAPPLFQMQSWTELANPRDLGKLFDSPDYMAWRSFRESDDSRYLALTMPRFLGRDSYGQRGETVDEFAFEEVTNGDHDKFLWCNSAYAMGTRITQSFAHYGWCSRIRGVEAGGLVEELPVPSFPTSSGELDYKCPTEIAISNRREKELSNAGMLALLHRKNTDKAAFIGAQTVNKPTVYEGTDGAAATANANLSARLPYIFASCRFAHYLNHMLYDWIGRDMSQDQMQRKLQNWVLNYVTGNPETANEELRAKQPLRAARTEVEEDPSNPGYYKARFYLSPHYQLEGVDVTIGMVAKLPTKGN